ncbi:hypothetical protein [uncultured Prochlorococcus sp.]|uniref:hypothetical protein n=1 Tax=uncultured Prochlorococcus sp. TaxID=159733 RepID=UPI00258F4BC9|nr:hypothetical protein [uncultured Prochlorococcus sp.]
MNVKIRSFFYIFSFVLFVFGIISILPFNDYVPLYPAAFETKVGSSWWPIPNSFQLFNPNNDIFFKFLILIYSISTFSLGSILKRGLGVNNLISLEDTKPIKYDKLMNVFANYTFGYFGFVALNRILTLIPQQIFSSFIFLFIVLGLNVYLFKCFLKNKNFINNMHDLIPEIGTGLILILIFLLSQIQFHGTHIGGDQHAYIIEQLTKLLNIDSSQNLVPLYGQHYDEILYGTFYPKVLSIFGHNFFNPLEIIWINSALIKLSIFSCLYLCIRQFTNIQTSIIISISAFFALFTAHPFYPTLLRIDAGAPLRMTLHSARAISAIYPFCIALLFIKNFKFNEINLFKSEYHKPKLDSEKILSFLLIGIGITSISISSIVDISLTLFFLLLAICILSASRDSREKNYTIKLTNYFTLLSLILIPLTFLGYFIKDSFDNWQFAILVFIICLLFSFFAIVLTVFRKRFIFKNYFFVIYSYFKQNLIYLFSGLLLGFIFLGNSIYEKLGFPLGNFFKNGISIREDILSIKVGFGVHNFCGQHPIMHCTNIKEFINIFGLPLIMAFAAILIIKLNKNQNFFIDKSILTSLLIPSLIIYLISIGLYDFSSGNLEPTEGDRYSLWIKTRFIDPWFHAIIISSLLTFLTNRNNIILFLGRSLCGISLFAPVLYNPQHGLPAEMLRNLEFLIRNYW